MNFIHGKYENNVFTSLDGSLTVKVSENDAKALDNHGSDVVLGIRPEHLVYGKAKENNVTVKVTGIEMLGSETVIYSLLGENSISIKTDKAVNGDATEVEVSFDNSKFYFFDEKTTLRIK
ncbi:MAG: TOBE domain-containing protein [Bacilli bacterium]|nr:TOBE domain-containing protein [Bacilli bacterium]